MSRPRVVLADDEPRFRETVARILDHHGFETSMVESGEQLLLLLQTDKPDVILLDMNMPGLGGGDVLPHVVGMRPDSRVIVLTGYGQDRDARKALEIGAFDYLCKPCDVSILMGRIRDAIRSGPGGRSEKNAAQVMIPLDDYTCVQASSTVRDGIMKLKTSSENLISLGLVMQSGHRAVLVFEGDDLAGVLTMRNLIEAVRPDYLQVTNGGLPHSLRYSPLFWSGLFSAGVSDLESKCIRDIMNPAPPVVDAQANLMQVAQLMYETNRRRVVVEQDGRVVGVVREQELFHEISRQILSR